MSKIIAANWKMNLSLSEAEDLAKNIKPSRNNIILCPPYVYMIPVKNINPSVKLGGQDCYYENKGAFTGDISPAMLKDIGCEYVITGHSERREHHKETDELINKKSLSAISNGLTPIICVGEKLTERENKTHKEIVKKQLEISLNNIDTNKIIIAYEPVWAIGTGKTATIAEISEMHDYIKSLVKSPLLYGGSVNEKNYKEILDINNVDGLLVGGASLSAEKFLQITSY